MARASKFLALAVAVSACSSVKVATEYNQSANFGGFKTYAWIPQAPGPEEAPAARDPRIWEAVTHSVDSGLAGKGLKKVAIDQSPDMLVAVHGWAVTQIDVRTYGYTYGAAPYGMYPGYGMSMHQGGVDVRQYRDGTMIIDLIDASTRQMVWRGTATDSFNPGAEAETITKAVAATLKEYPPPPPPK